MHSLNSTAAVVAISCCDHSLVCVHVAAMKIQVSDSTAQLLRTVGGFTMECRGTIQVKVRMQVIPYCAELQALLPTYDWASGTGVRAHG